MTKKDKKYFACLSTLVNREFFDDGKCPCSRSFGKHNETSNILVGDVDGTLAFVPCKKHLSIYLRRPNSWTEL